MLDAGGLSNQTKQSVDARLSTQPIPNVRTSRNPRAHRITMHIDQINNKEARGFQLIALIRQCTNRPNLRDNQRALGTPASCFLAPNRSQAL